MFHILTEMFRLFGPFIFFLLEGFHTLVCIDELKNVVKLYKVYFKYFKKFFFFLLA